MEVLHTSAATPLVKILRMIQLQKAILAVGMFSMFEAIVQDRLNCSDGFREATVVLRESGRDTLAQRFNDFRGAVNILKHGRGTSYDALVARAADLPFRIKLPGEAFYFEGDVSEVSTLIEVDDQFVLSCTAVVRDVSEVVRAARPRTFL